MAISDTQKVDLLYKKIAWSVAKTDTNPPKEAYNESTPSPLLIRGDTLWQLSGSIPASIPSTTSSIVQVYKDGSGSWSATIECTELAVTDNRTWSTGLTNWIDPEFGSTYFVKVYVDSSGSTTPQTTGTALQAAGVNDDQWYFDYQAGILNFIGTNLPTSIATGVTGKSVFISGARYVGPTGATSFPNGLTLGNITINGNTITGNTDITFGGNITTGNILTNNLLYPNGVPFSFGSTYSNTNVASYLSSNTITGNISTQGNVTATYYYGSGAYLTGLPASYGNTNVATFLSHLGSNNIVTTGTFSGNIIADTITPYKTSSTVFNSTTAVGLPSGNTVQRPSSPAQGYTRYNTDTSTIEYWDGVAWVQVVNGVADQIITPDGTSSAYTLTQASSTIGVLVSINGTVQIPGVSYTVSGLTILFTETPLVTDIIDIRFLASAVSYNFPSNQSTYLNTVTASTAPTLLDTFPITGNATVNWVISANDTINTKYKSSTVSSLNDGTTVYYTESAILKTTTSNVAEFTSNITAGNINLWAVGDSANVAVTFERLVLGAATPAGYLTAGIYVNNPTINALVSGSKEFILTQDGNVTLPAGGMINYANGVSILTGITSGSGSTYSNTNVAAYLISGNITTGNILPQANITYSLGSASYQWQSLWVSGNTIYLGNTPLSISNGQLTVNGVPVGSTYSNANVVANLQNYVTSISTTANITTTANVIGTTFMFANGVNILSTVSAGSTYSNANVAAYLTTDSTVTALQANLGVTQIWANANIASINANIGGYYTWANANVSGLYNSILGANAAIVTANSAVVSYVNTLNTAMASNVAGANAAIITANTAMKLYVDAGNTTQSNQINSINANLGSYYTWANANVAGLSSQITGANATISALQANVGSYYTWANANVAGLSNSIIGANATISALQANLGSYYTWANANVAGLSNSIIGANATISALQANVGSYYTWANANVAGLQSSITSLRTTANTNTAAYLAAGISTNVTTTGNISAGNVLINGAPISIGTVNPDYIHAGRITSDQTGVGAGSDVIFNSTVVSSGVSMNTSTGVFTLTANKTYRLFGSVSFVNFSSATGWLIYQWVDATTNTALDTSGISVGVAEALNRDVSEFNATSAQLIYTPSTNQTIKLRITDGGGTATIRSSIGTKATIEQINPTFALQSNITFANITATNTANVGNLITTSGIYWANGTAWSSTTGTTYSNANVAAYLTAGNISIGNVGYTVLPNTVTQFTSNVNSYGQINAQNINSGSAATTDIIVTANNGTDTVFFADLGIAGSAYNVNSPNNSLGNVIYANDTYLYAQGNTSANIGGNLAIGAVTAGRTVTIFAGGINKSSNVATFANTGVTVYGNVAANYFTGNGSALTGLTYNQVGNISGTSSNVTLVAGNYNFVFDNTGTTTVGNINVTYNPTTTIGTGVVITAGNTIGGTGYADVIKITNNATGSTNPNKTFRLNSTGGLEIIDSTYSNNLFTLTNAGALTIKSTFTPGAYRVGEVIKTTMLYPGDMGISADVSITGGNIATYSYTPVSSSSYIIAEFGGRWEVNGTSIDSWWSNLYVASTQVGTGHMNWTTAGDGTLGRTGGFFPLAGRYTNTDTGIKAIYAQANRDTSDDNFIMRYTSGIGFWMKITEIGR